MKRGIQVAAVGSAFALLFAGGLAWACTEAATISLGANSGPAGTPVSVTGSSFAEGPVEVRWNSRTGEILATGQGPEFTVSITPPAGTPPEVYYIVAIQSGPEGTFSASETLEVTGPSGRTGSSVSSELWSGFERTARLSNASAEAAGPGDPSLITGLGLVGTGAAALAGGLVLATARRRAGGKEKRRPIQPE